MYTTSPVNEIIYSGLEDYVKTKNWKPEFVIDSVNFLKENNSDHPRLYKLIKMADEKIQCAEKCNKNPKGPINLSRRGSNISQEFMESNDTLKAYQSDQPGTFVRVDDVKVDVQETLDGLFGSRIQKLYIDKKQKVGWLCKLRLFFTRNIVFYSSPSVVYGYV